MRRALKATICNEAHPEYGAVSLPFPIKLEEYDENLKMLDALGIGDPIEQDCFVAEISTAYPVLKCLEGSSVNVDELDYLIKYLDSFTPDEVTAFQGAAWERKIADLPGLINLAFSCSQVVAVEDFRNLERVGIWLLLARNTSVDPPELDRDTAVKTAIDALSSGEGIVTPYGVIFENGMELQTVYDGRIFPEYSYEAPLVTVEIPVSAKHSTYAGEVFTFEAAPESGSKAEEQSASVWEAPKSERQESSGYGWTPPEPEWVDLDAYAQEVLTLTNTQREAAGLNPLSADPVLTEMAMLRARELEESYGRQFP